MKRNFLKDLNNAQGYTAFTIAEVLIVLGIIGIIAEVTIPALMHDFQDAEFKSKLKKEYSVMSQAYQELAFDNGGQFADSISGCSEYENSCLKDVFKQKLKWVKECDTNADPNLGSCFVSQDNVKYLNGHSANSYYFNGNDTAGLILNDGASIAFSLNSRECASLSSPNRSDRCAFLVFDVNGPNLKPNAWGRDLYVFIIFAKVISPGGVGIIDTMVADADDCNTGTNRGYTCASKYIGN
jgi:type II secretory pathway pseudopilin PulG